MADNYLEKHYAEYEARKAEWLKKKKLGKHATTTQRRPARPEDESL